MIKKITLQNIASYKDVAQSLDNLNTVNVIFGENGSGKSTIANFIKDEESEIYESCNIEWLGSSMKKVVYNKDFINNTLRETKIKGVFTFGEDAGKNHDDLVKLQEEKNIIYEKKQNLKENIEECNSEVENKEKKFTDRLWKICQKYKPLLGKALQGGIGSKEVFKNKCLEKINAIPSMTVEEIIEQTEIFFQKQPLSISPLPIFDYSKLNGIENYEGYHDIIIGKDDVQIAGLIQKLGNSDWVRQGVVFFTEDKCPFCQQITPKSLRSDIENYFDESFSKKVKAIRNNISLYNDFFSNFKDYYENLSHQESDFFSRSTYDSLFDSIYTIYKKNKIIQENKLKEPSLSVTIEKTESMIREIILGIKEANCLIEDFNKKIKNINEERGKVRKHAWDFIGSKAKEIYEDYKIDVDPVHTKLKSMTDRRRKFKEDLDKLTTRIGVLERRITSTAPSKDGINRILKSFGFENFQIEDAEEGYYKIVREDGSFVQNTLSEGERTFITFLYFYQLIHGGFSSEGLATPKIVVFDDPVSSLDSKILFVVSTLIRSLFSKEKMKKLNIAQYFILTHNVYFHKEVTLSNGLKKLGKSSLRVKDFSFWIIRKQLGTSILEHYEENPIKTNYQLLWQEVRKCIEDPSLNVHICNTLRRILENYFNILGDKDFSDLKFEGIEMIAYRSLISWIQDGSHCLDEGIDVGIGQDLTSHYLHVFKKIFEQTNHLSHYNMMMHIENEDEQISLHAS